MPFPCLKYTGNRKYWTRERVIESLKMAADIIEGPLPCLDEKYSAIKKGHLDWPPAVRVLEYFGAMARGWLAAGVDPARITLHNVPWLKEEDDYLLEHAGNKTLSHIANHLHRTYQGVRVRLGKNHGIASRHNQGYMSAAELAKMYNCSCHRIRSALKQGTIKGRFDRRRNRWEIDLVNVLGSPAAQMILNRPKRTHKTQPTDLGDYYQRHGLCRKNIDGKVVVVNYPVPRAQGVKEESDGTCTYYQQTHYRKLGLQVTPTQDSNRTTLV